MSTCDRRSMSGEAEDAALADDDPVRRDQRRELFADVSSDTSKVRRLRLLMPIELRAERQRAVELRPVMHLDEHIHAEFVRGVDELARLGVGDARHDDEDAVGPPGAGLEDLIGLEQEILAQSREAGGVARLRQVFGPALERRARR